MSAVIADRLNECLAELDLSQSELARRIDVRPQAVQLRAHGGKARLEHIRRAARAMGVSPMWLESGRGHKNVTKPTATEQDLIDALVLRLETASDGERALLVAMLQLVTREQHQAGR